MAKNNGSGKKQPKATTMSGAPSGELDNPVLPGNVVVLPKEEKKKKEKPRFGPLRMELMIRHDFTDSELLALGTKLGAENARGAQVESEKKAVMSNYKSQTDAIKAVIQDVSEKIGTRFEMRSAGCLVHHDFANREKYIYDGTTGKFYRKENFVPSDSQAQMSFLPGLPKKFAHGTDLPKSYLEKVRKAEEAAKKPATK